MKPKADSTEKETVLHVTCTCVFLLCLLLGFTSCTNYVHILITRFPHTKYQYHVYNISSVASIGGLGVSRPPRKWKWIYKKNKVCTTSFLMPIPVMKYSLQHRKKTWPASVLSNPSIWMS